jgi:hypothetical protein
MNIPHVTRIRSRAGNVTAELPVALWVIFFALFFPMLNLATSCIRITFLYFAAHNGCISASRARTFSIPVDGQPPAVQAAQTGANALGTLFTGVHIASVQTQIVTTNLNTSVQTIQTTPLKTPADVSTNTYQIQVSVSGAADPLIPLPLVNVAGLSSPLNVTFSDRQFCENPMGLTL